MCYFFLQKRIDLITAEEHIPVKLTARVTGRLALLPQKTCAKYSPGPLASCEASGSVQKGGYRRALVDLDVVAGAVQQRGDRAQVLG